MLWVYVHYTYFFLSVWGSTLDVRIVEIAPRAERVNVKLVHEQVVRYFLVIRGSVSLVHGLTRPGAPGAGASFLLSDPRGRYHPPDKKTLPPCCLTLGRHSMYWPSIQKPLRFVSWLICGICDRSAGSLLKEADASVVERACSA